MAKKKNKNKTTPQKKFSQKDYLRTKMRSLPLGACYVSPSDPNASEVTVFVSRQHPAGTLSIGAYLIDKYCCGVKDTFLYFSIHPSENEEMLQYYKRRMTLREIPYVEAHNLIYGSLEYAESIGIPPHKDFSESQYILSEDNDDIPLIEYEFGKDGRPTLISSSLKEIDHYKRLMLQKLKPDEFDVLFIGTPPKSDDWRFDDEDDAPDGDENSDCDEEDSYGLAIRWEGDKGGVTVQDIDNLAQNRKADIQKLDAVRKVVYFSMMLGIAQSVPPAIIDLKDFIDASRKAINNYNKYGDVAFGEANELLFQSVQSGYTLLLNPKAKITDTEGLYDLFMLCIGYATVLHRVNMEQDIFLSQLISEADTEKAKKLMLNEARIWIHMRLEALEKRIVNANRPNADDSVEFDIGTLTRLTGKWQKEGTRTHVKRLKYGFVSKDPANYYRRKVRETLDHNFTNEDDFMGLVIVLNNLAMTTIKFVHDREWVQAYYILTNILFETLWSVYGRHFDQWIAEKGDVRTNLSILLGNTMTIFSNMIMRGMIEPSDLGSLYTECLRLRLVAPSEYSDIIDLHPMIYSIENQMFCKDPF